MSRSPNLAAAIAALLFLTPALEAVPHLHPELYPNVKPCHAKHITPEMSRRYGFASAKVIAQGMATGIKNIAVIIVRFPSAGGTTSGTPGISNINNFDAYFSNTTGMQKYYFENSFGVLDLHFTFFGENAGAVGQATAAAAGSILMPQPMEYYGCGDVDSGCSGVTAAPAGLGGAYLIRDALLLARAGLPARPTLNSATYDAVLVMHAGYGNETSVTTTNGDIWSAFYQEPAVIGAGGGGFVDGATFPELEHQGYSPLGVMCHEFGHVLTLPDLYNTAVFGGASVVGNWELMDSGPYLNNGSNPAHMGAWDKAYLGWTTPQTAASRANFSVGPIETASPSPSQIIKMPVQNGGALEYFLLEYRNITSGTFDRSIPGTGLLIWHVDDSITAARGFSATNPALQNTVNASSPPGVSIVTADGGGISNANKGAPGNAYSNFDNFISPKSDNYSGQPSGVSVVKINGVGTATATFEVVNLAVTASQSIAKLINFPNPAGKGYSHPSGEGHTTLQFLLGRPASDYQINIYTLSGDLVRKVDKSEMNLNTDRSADAKWVYEFDWDLKNGSGQHVAPGVYLYLVRADGQSKSAKAVIIR